MCERRVNLRVGGRWGCGGVGETVEGWWEIEETAVDGWWEREVWGVGGSKSKG